jgi:GT2 family glycosyltransferase
MESKKEKVKVSIIILSWNTKELLKQCVESILNNCKRGGKKNELTEIVIVDNGSTDGSKKYINELTNYELTNCGLQIRAILNKKNLGFGAGNNQGMRVAKGEYFLLLNSDTIVKNRAWLKMAEFMDKNPQVGVVGCRLLNPDGSWQPSCGYFPNLPVAFLMLFAEHWLGSLVRFSPKKTKEVDWVMGAAMMIRPEVIKKAGLMDEGIFMYMDEVEWCWRIKKAGWKIIFWPGAEIVHFGGGSSPSGRKWPIVNIYRGLLYFYQKHKPFWQKEILKFMLKSKAWLAISLGKLTGNKYLVETYEEAKKII